MLKCVAIVFLAAVSRGLSQTCLRSFYDAEEAILNGSLELLPSLSSAFYPTSEEHTEYLVIHYLYALNCSDGGSSNYSHLSNHTFDYIWASSSAFLVVEPNALEDLTCGLIDVFQGSLSINMQCLCPSYPNDVTDILSRLTAYLRCYAKKQARPERDDSCKINSFFKRYDPHDPLYEKVDAVISTLKIVSWLSLVLMLFLQFKVLSNVYPVIYHNQKDWLSITWATFFISIVVLAMILSRDADSEMLDSVSNSRTDYKELYAGVYITWSIGLIASFWFPKNVKFPIPVLTEVMLKWINTTWYSVLTYIIQSLMIWIMFCVIQLLTLHAIFFSIALLAKPASVLLTLAYVFTFIALAISGTSVTLEVLSLRRINPMRAKTVGSRNSYKRDLLSIHTSVLLPLFLVALMFLSYQFADKLGSSLDFIGTPAAIAGIIHAIFLFVLSIALRHKKFLGLFDEVKDESNHRFVYSDDVKSTKSEEYFPINND